MSNEAKASLNDIGYDPNIGARSVLRAINSEFKKEISRILLSVHQPLGTISVNYVEGKFTYILTTPNPSVKKSLFEVEEKDYDFETAEEAQEYARQHVGETIVL